MGYMWIYISIYLLHYYIITFLQRNHFLSYGNIRNKKDVRLLKGEDSEHHARRTGGDVQGERRVWTSAWRHLSLGSHQWYLQHSSRSRFGGGDRRHVRSE